MRWRIWRGPISGLWYANGLYYQRFRTWREAFDYAYQHPLPQEPTG